MTKTSPGRPRPYATMTACLLLFVCIGLVSSTAVIAEEITFTAPLESLSPLMVRPLFSGNRRAIETSIQTPINAETTIMPPLEGVLLGLAKGDDGIGFAIIRLNDEAQPMRIQIGDVIRGWQLTTIDNHTALFLKDGQTTSLAFP